MTSEKRIGQRSSCFQPVVLWKGRSIFRFQRIRLTEGDNQAARLASRLAALLAAALMASTAMAADNELTAAEKAEGWILRFDGKSLDNWMTSNGRASNRPIEEYSINPHGSGHYMLVHKQLWENFVLAVDFKISKGCNSGVFVRTFPL